MHGPSYTAHLLSAAVVLFGAAMAQMLSPAGQVQEHFTVEPQNVTAFVGTTNVRLHTEFSNGGVYPYWEVYDNESWYCFDSSETYNGQYWIDPVNGDLYVPVLKECHAGVYRGVVSVGKNRVMYSNPATIMVLRPPLLQLCNNQTVCIDSTLTSASVCVITDRNPGVDWALYKLVGQTLVATTVQVTLQPYVAMHSFTCQAPVNQTTPSNISLTNSNLLASGQYVLVANDAYGNRSVSFNISIAGPDAPQINKIPNLIAQNYSQPVSIPCFAQPGCEGQAVSSGLTALWTKGGAVVPENPSLPVYTINTLNGSTLVFTSLQSSQTGQYTCKATNSKGTATASTTVYGPPDPVSDLLSSVNQGVVTFSWTPPTPGPFVISYSLYYGIVGGNVKTEIDTITPGAVVSISQLGTYEAYMVTIGKLSSVILESSASNYVQFTIQSSPTGGTSPVVIGSKISTAIPVISLVICLVICLVISVLLALMWHHRQKMDSHKQCCTLEGDTKLSPDTYCAPPLVISSNGHMSPDSRISIEYEVHPKWEFPPDLLQLSEILYDGFSTVLYKGTANGIKSDKAIDVAVKCCKDQTSEENVRALIANTEQLASLGSHPNIVDLLRVCTVESPVCMVVEYMCHGDLLGFLRASRGHHGMYTVFPGKREQLPSLNLTSRDLINIATKIASGMTFLAERKVVHGSLCARNVLVGTSLDIKINVGAYDLNRDSLLKWMAPETLFDGTSTTYSDVWSFGVTMWELVTLGGTPYAEILPSDLYPQLLGGMRMPKPMHCAQEVYDIIRLCWEKLPMDRLSFATLHERLDALSHSKVSFLDEVHPCTTV